MTETKGCNSSNLGWDETLPEKYLPRWMRCWNSLNYITKIQLQQCYTPPTFGPIKKTECHIFSDASNEAIGAVAYLRLTNHEDNVNVSFILGKAKVNPTHAVSIPRLELCAAVLATELAQKITSEIGLNIDNVIYHTDSEIVLGYINNSSKRFHVYVANRVEKIHNISSPHQWRHVSTHANLADIASCSIPAPKLN
ncbi:uncharacterized protein [Ptychodera flava]|uniref:uncharacterized protein n=1 Tax=Ptychodera flava TaxID=63121 RepID=UPI00396A6178